MATYRDLFRAVQSGDPDLVSFRHRHVVPEAVADRAVERMEAANILVRFAPGVAASGRLVALRNTKASEGEADALAQAGGFSLGDTLPGA